MEIYCTRPGCSRPLNFFTDLDDSAMVKTVQQKYCTNCGMLLILIGRYLPSKLLGRGGFGAAFLARDRYTPAMRRCVVKQFQPAGDLSPEQLQIAQNLFEREGEVLEELGTHPQIPDLYAFFELTVPNPQQAKEDKFFYLVQEFIDGQTLEEQLVEKGQFSENEVIALLEDLLPVLQFVHEHGSIHRDIKPSNIMRHRNGRLYLLDFGAVKTAASGVTVKGATVRSTGIYSMGFAPPEQMAGGRIYPSTDLYALAVTCLTLLTGKQAIELFDAYNNRWNWKSSVQVSATLAAILDRMLLNSPNQRFQSAQDVISALAPISSSSLLPRQIPTSQTPPPPVSPPQSLTPQTPPLPIPQTQPPASQTPPPPVPQPQSIPTQTSPPPRPQPQSIPTQASPPSPQPSAPQPQVSSRPRFSLIEILAAAGFTGAEGSLLFIALTSLLPSPSISFGLLGMLLGGLIFAQYKRIIEGFVDLPLILGITLAVVIFVPPTRTVITSLIAGNPQIGVLIVALLAGAGAIAVTALFQLVYKLVARIF